MLLAEGNQKGIELRIRPMRATQRIQFPEYTTTTDPPHMSTLSQDNRKEKIRQEWEVLKFHDKETIRRRNTCWFEQG